MRLTTARQTNLARLTAAMLIGFSFGTAALAEDLAPYAVGKADVKGDDRVYYEIHYRAEGSTAETVDYRWSNGETIIKKSLDFSKGEGIPSFKQENLLNGEFTEVRHVGDNELEVSYRSKSGEETVTKTMTYSEPLVIDAGFDHHVRANWDAIESGKTINFEYLVPARHLLLGMRAKPTRCQNKENLCLNVEVSNFVLRWLVSPLKLEYSKDTRQLKRFVGMTNVSDENKNVLEADIAMCHDCPAPSFSEAKAN